MFSMIKNPMKSPRINERHKIAVKKYFLVVANHFLICRILNISDVDYALPNWNIFFFYLKHIPFSYIYYLWNFQIVEVEIFHILLEFSHVSKSCYFPIIILENRYLLAVIEQRHLILVFLGKWYAIFNKANCRLICPKS